jgi:CMP-N-acetylneuraminic acid synthetase
MTWIEQNTAESYDAVMLLEPSSPFARSCDYDQAIELLMRRNANAVVGMRTVEPNTVFVGAMDDQGRITAIIDKMAMLAGMRRQDFSQEFTMNGALYVFRWEYFKQHHNIYQDREGVYGYAMDPHYSVEIDSQFDLDLATFLVETGRVDIRNWVRNCAA